MLTAGWTDGNTFVPLSFNLQSSEKAKNRFCEMKDGLNKNSIAYRRRKQAISKSTDVMIDMLKTVVKAGIPAKHVLFDSWFSYPSTIMKILELKLHIVGRLKNTTKIKYIFDASDNKLDVRLVFVRDRNDKKKWIGFICTDLSLTEEQIISLYRNNKDKRTMGVLLLQIGKNI